MNNQTKNLQTQWNKRYKGGHYSKEEPVDFVVKNIEKYGKTFVDKKILDIGCGNGRNLVYLAREGYICSGIDISEEAITQLQQRLHEENLESDVKVGDFTHLPFDNNFFSSIICINVLQHNNWENAVNAFKEIARVLEPKGIIFIAVRSTSRELPEDATLIKDKGITFVSKTGTKAGITLHHYSLEEIEELCQLSGLKLIESNENIKMKEGQRRGHWEVVIQKID